MSDIILSAPVDKPQPPADDEGVVELRRYRNSVGMEVEMALHNGGKVEFAGFITISVQRGGQVMQQMLRFVIPADDIKDAFRKFKVEAEKFAKEQTSKIQQAQLQANLMNANMQAVPRLQRGRVS